MRSSRLSTGDQRKIDCERRSIRFGTRNPHVATDFTNDFLRQVQAKACPIRFGREKWFKDPIQVPAVDSRPIILYDNAKRICVDEAGNANGAGSANGRNRVYGIGNQVQKNLGQLAFMRNDLRRYRRQTQLQCDAVEPQLISGKLDGAADRVVNVDAFEPTTV